MVERPLPEELTTPGRRRWPLWLRIILIAVVTVAVLYGLFFYLFPWVEQIFENPIIEEA